MEWQVEEVEHHFGEVVERAHTEGAQVVTKNGDKVAVVVDIDDYRRLTMPTRNFGEFLLRGPYVDVDDETPPEQQRITSLDDGT